MRNTFSKVLVLLTFLHASMAGSALAAPAAKVGQRPEDRRPTFIAAIQSVQGGAPDVKIRALGEEEFRPAQVGQQLLEGTSIWTEPGSMARLHVSGIAILHLAPGTLVTFVKSKENYPVLCRAHVEEGTVWTTVQPGQPFTVEAANASGRARGTQFRTSYDASTRDSEWEMLEGKLDLYRLPSNHKETLVQGQRMTVGPTGAPRGATPIQVASLTEARGLFTRSLGGAQPPDSSSVGATTSPTGGNVVYMRRPPGGVLPTGAVPAGLLGAVALRPQSFGAVIATPAIPIHYGGIQAGRAGGLALDPGYNMNQGVRLTQPMSAPAGRFDDSGLATAQGQDRTSVDTSRNVKVTNDLRSSSSSNFRNLPSHDFGQNLGGSHFGRR